MYFLGVNVVQDFAPQAGETSDLAAAGEHDARHRGIYTTIGRRLMSKNLNSLMPQQTVEKVPHPQSDTLSPS